VIADKWQEYQSRVLAGEKAGDVLDSLGIERYCCRRMFISHVEVIDDVILFSVSKAVQSGGSVE
jgi:DNA-directed RNA polymerase subunit N